MRVWVGWLNDLFCYAWEDTSVLWKCKHEASVDLPKFLVLTCSCLACPLVGVGPYGWRCSLLESPCALSLIVVGSFTLFTVGCGCTVNLVLCLLCGWIFHCVVCGTARHLYFRSGFFLCVWLNLSLVSSSTWKNVICRCFTLLALNTTYHILKHWNTLTLEQHTMFEERTNYSPHYVVCNCEIPS